MILGRFCAGLGDLLAVDVILVGMLCPQLVIVDPELIYLVLFAGPVAGLVGGLGVCSPLRD